VAAAATYGLSWPHTLFSYQNAGIDKLLDAPSVLLADENGLGENDPSDRGIAGSIVANCAAP